MVASAAPAFQGHAMVLLGAATAFLLLLAIGRRQGTPTGLALATYMALGIGLHRLGEGLAIGAAFTAGAGPRHVPGPGVHTAQRYRGYRYRCAARRLASLAYNLRRARAARGCAGDCRHLAREPQLCAPLVRARTSGRGRGHSSSRRRGRGISDPPRRAAWAGCAQPEHGCRARSRHRGDVRNRHAGGGVGRIHLLAAPPPAEPRP